MSANLTDSDKETINRITVAGLQELLRGRPELLDLGVETVASIYLAGCRAGVEACCEVLT